MIASLEIILSLNVSVEVAIDTAGGTPGDVNIETKGGRVDHVFPKGNIGYKLYCIDVAE